MTGIAIHTIYGEHDYSLPFCSRSFDEVTDVLRKSPKEKIENWVHSAWVDAEDYENDDKRMIYLAAHFIANELGLAAPAFRVILQQNKHDRLTELETLIARDRQLIDLHYLYCHHRRELKFRTEDRTVDFLSTRCSSFDMKAAMNFVCIGARKFIKTEKMLGIPEHIQLCLTYFQADKVRKQVKRYGEKAQEIAVNLRSYAKSSKSQLKPEKEDSLIDDLLPLLLAKGDITLAIELKLAMEGSTNEPRIRRSYSRRLSESKRWFLNKYPSLM